MSLQASKKSETEAKVYFRDGRDAWERYKKPCWMYLWRELNQLVIIIQRQRQRERELRILLLDWRKGNFNNSTLVKIQKQHLSKKKKKKLRKQHRAFEIKFTYMMVQILSLSMMGQAPLRHGSSYQQLGSIRLHSSGMDNIIISNSINNS